ncbi:MAG: hypothetical protein KatS3mg113_0230 [Planctomycetaceae bacterium]|nr:MAG: hypothetical protein KatS3mg113_0230 [Planctomycetaceae bacterium]
MPRGFTKKSRMSSLKKWTPRGLSGENTTSKDAVRRWRKVIGLACLLLYGVLRLDCAVGWGQEIQQEQVIPPRPSVPATAPQAEVVPPAETQPTPESGTSPSGTSQALPYVPWESAWSTRSRTAVAGGAPGGLQARIGAPYLYVDPATPHAVVGGDPYTTHWGPGFHRHSFYGHYRFPYYNYRAPWYYPGRAVYQRDTNFPW